MSFNDDHCWHEASDQPVGPSVKGREACCWCSATRDRIYCSQPVHPATDMHGTFLPRRLVPNGYTEPTNHLCNPHSYRALTGEPCLNCKDTGQVSFWMDTGWDEGWSSYPCGCRQPPHDWHENGDLDKCRVCQLPSKHPIHSYSPGGCEGGPAMPHES